MRRKSEFRLHRPIGISLTKRGVSLSVQDLIRKTSGNVQDSYYDPRLKHEFPNGLPEVSEDELLDYLPLHTGLLRDFTDVDRLKDYAREEIKRQYTDYQTQEKRKRAVLAEQRKQFAAFLQRGKENVKTDPSKSD